MFFHELLPVDANHYEIQHNTGTTLFAQTFEFETTVEGEEMDEVKASVPFRQNLIEFIFDIHKFRFQIFSKENSN